MIEHLKTKRKYTDQNLKGYSYDWRYTPIYIRNPDGEFAMIKQLVEHLYTNNSNQRVVLVTHSLGGVVTQAFFESRILGVPSKQSQPINSFFRSFQM